jgi:hypothetical protein
MGSEERPAKGTVRGDPRLGTLKRPQGESSKHYTFFISLTFCLTCDRG